MNSFRQNSIQTDIFTPRSYQVELLHSALKRNTIVCLGTGTSKEFIAIMLIKEMAHQIRPPLVNGGKRTIYLVNNIDLVQEQAQEIRMHLEVNVAGYSEIEGYDVCNIDQVQVLILTASLFLDMLQHNIISMAVINLIIFDECHLALNDHPYVKIMESYNACPEPRILGLTASVLNNTCKSPVQLEQNLVELETALQSTAETASDILLADLFSARPKERVIECEAYDDKTGLVQEFSDQIESILNFFQDYSVPEDEGVKDPTALPRTILMECHYVLHVLGPWCAGRIAGSLTKQLCKLIDHEHDPMSKLFLGLAHTQLNVMNQVIDDIYDIKVQCLEDFWMYLSPKVLRLIEILQDYKPDDNFMIIGDDDIMDFGGIDSDEDSLNLSDEDDFEDEKGEKKKKQNPIHYVAVKRLQPEGVNPYREENCICGIVFMARRHAAFALNKLIVELCNWDPDLFFIKSHHLTGHVIGKAGESEVLYKKQEGILRKFRQKELNLLISTSVLEEGVDVPRCNLIVRFDLPTDYRSYVQSKGRARASKSKYFLLVDHLSSETFAEELKIFKGIEQILMSKCHSREDREEEDREEIADEDIQYYRPIKEDADPEEDSPKVTLTGAIGLVNRYCAKLPSDVFTHLTPKCTVVLTNDDPPKYTASLQLPINSPIKEPIKNQPQRSKKLAKMNVALMTCEILHKAGELDSNLLPVGKEIIKYEDEENEWEEAELHGQARPGTTKRKQYYYKRIAQPLLGHPITNKPCYLYRFDCQLTCPITDEQNTRGRRIHAPEESPRGFGIITEKKIPLVPYFPVFTRSGEVTVQLELIYPDKTFTTEELDKMKQYHRFVFSKVLRLEKDPMMFDPENADCSYILIPLNSDENGEVIIDWEFMAGVACSPMKQSQRKYLFQPNKKKFIFNTDDFDDAVVMPSYRNIDQPQYFYVAEIRHDLHPKSSFPSPELYDTFEHYYCSKYGLEITNMDQPLLDVDHTSARLNLLTPRYMNQKGVALPTSSVETRRARRENLQQKQILLPELCDIHRFPASLWRKAVCIPAILYRINYLLIADELRMQIAEGAHIGVSNLPEDFRFPQLEFGFSTKPSDAVPEKKFSEKTNVEALDSVLHSDSVGDTVKIYDLENHDDSILKWGKNGNINTRLKLQNIELTNEEIGATNAIDNVTLATFIHNSSHKLNEDQDKKQNCADEAGDTQTICSNTWNSDAVNENKDVIATPDIMDKKQREQHVHNITSCSENQSPLKSFNGIELTDSTCIYSLVQSESTSDKPTLVSIGTDCDTSTGAQSLPEGIDNMSIKTDYSAQQCAETVRSHESSNDEDTSATLTELSDPAKAVPIIPSKPKSVKLIRDSSNFDESSNIEFDKDADLESFVGPSPCTILQTLTMSNANDFFNLERLETIGDSFLKFAITVYLYCSYPGIHEGKLSYLRSRQVSNYNLYKLGKKKGLPDCMVAAKFEPTENWLPPGYLIQKEGAYKGLSVHIASQLKPSKHSEEEDNSDISDSDLSSDRESTVGSPDMFDSGSNNEHDKFSKELEAVISMDDGEKMDVSHVLKNLIPYNLQTQHSLPDKSIADCVEALIGCYLTTCGQRAALQFMSWLGLKVLPSQKIDPLLDKVVTVKAFSMLPLPPSPLLTHVPEAASIVEYCLDGYEAFEQRIQYTFKDRSYLLQAFTHASYHYNTVTDCYQRLEFLGDAILDYVITRHLFEDSRRHSPGILTDLRSALVNNNIFAALSVKWDFHKYFKAISPQLFYVVEKFVTSQKEKNDEIGLDEEVEEDDNDTTEIPKALGDIFESVAGAIYLDSGMSLDTVWRVYYRMMQPQIDAFTLKIPKSPVRELLEMEPETAKFEKPERTMHGKIRVTVNVVGKGSFCGVGRNYRIAKSTAARRALKYIKQYNLTLDNHSIKTMFMT